MNHDGTKQGFALDITATLSAALPVPIIASGGGGNEAHFYDVFTTGKADAALAASIFHYKEVAIPHLKKYLNELLKTTTFRGIKNFLKIESS
jgi:cyclase